MDAPEQFASLTRSIELLTQANETLMGQRNELLHKIGRLSDKNQRQRTELRRLNKTLRSIWDGVRFAHACKVEADKRYRAKLDEQRDLNEVDRVEREGTV